MRHYAPEHGSLGHSPQGSQGTTAQGRHGQPFSAKRLSVRRHGRGAIVLLGAMAWLACAGPAAASPPAAPFPECPGYGLDSSCGDLIVINAQGGLESYVDESQASYGSKQGGYDGEGDELIG